MKPAFHELNQNELLAGQSTHLHPWKRSNHICWPSHNRVFNDHQPSAPAPSNADWRVLNRRLVCTVLDQRLALLLCHPRQFKMLCRRTHTRQVQGWTKITFPGFVNMSETVAFSCLQQVQRRQLFHLIFTHRGNIFFVQPCILHVKVGIA